MEETNTVVDNAPISDGNEPKFTQAEIDKIVTERLAREKQKAEKEKEELLAKENEEKRRAQLSTEQKIEELKKQIEEAEKQSVERVRRLEFENRLIAGNVPEEVRTSLLASINVDAMESFNIEPFKSVPTQGGSKAPEIPKDNLDYKETVNALKKYL